jgi:hypothetical protein
MRGEVSVQYRRLGRAGALVAPLALGTDNILNPTPEDESSRMIIRALDGGINLIDTSNSYGAGEAERVIGRVLSESGRRDEVVIATKLHYPTGPAPTTEAIRGCTSCGPAESLRRLQTDRIDLYQLHRPDFEVPMEETLGALDRPRAAGQGLLHRQFDRAGVEGVGGWTSCRPEGLRTIRDRATSVQLARSPGRERAGADGIEVRPRAVAVVSAGDGRTCRALRGRQHSSRGITRRVARRFAQS